MIKVYFGKSAAGKDTFLRKDVAEGVMPCISATTRPMREGEQDGVDYYFISKEEFLRRIANNEFVEYRKYDTLVEGKPATWYYGAPPVNPSFDYVTVLDIGGLKEFIDYYGADNIEPVYVETDDVIRKERAMKRGSFDEIEWDRRFADDDVKFSKDEVQSVANMIGRPITVINNDGDEPVYGKLDVSEGVIKAKELREAKRGYPHNNLEQDGAREVFEEASKTIAAASVDMVRAGIDPNDAQNMLQNYVDDKLDNYKVLTIPAGLLSLSDNGVKPEEIPALNSIKAEIPKIAKKAIETQKKEEKKEDVGLTMKDIEANNAKNKYFLSISR